MHDSGIVRRVDELGRLVIPKELRKTLRIKSGDAIQIDKEGESIVLKKYSPIDSAMSVVQSLADGIFQSTNKTCIITDTDKIIYSTNKELYEEGCILNNFCQRIMQDRKFVNFSSSHMQIPAIYVGEQVNGINSRSVVPYVKEGDCYGLIILSGENYENTDDEKKILAFGALVLSKII